MSKVIKNRNNISKKGKLIYLGMITGVILLTLVLYGLAVSKKKHPSESSSIVKISVQEKKPLETVSAFKISVQDLDHLETVFANHNYQFAHLMTEKEVPRLYFENMPKDLRDIKDLATKKSVFIQIILPMILKVNEDTLKERTYLIELKEKNNLTSEENEWLQNLAQKYEMETVDMKELLKRVDIIPPSMALGQAIIETGWGHSYASLEKNSIFGITLKSGVKFYDSLLESTYSYIRNLNYNHAYREMRELRAEFRKNNKELDSHALIGKLIRYSEQRKLYIKKVRSAIAKNDLKEFDDLQLEKLPIMLEAEAPSIVVGGEANKV